MPLRKFRKLFEKHGVTVTQVSATHVKLSKKIDGKIVLYVVVAKHGRQVDHIYVQKAKRRYGIKNL